MEEKIVIVLNEMSEYLSITQMKKLQEVIIKTFADNEVSKVEISNEEFLEMDILLITFRLNRNLSSLNRESYMTNCQKKTGKRMRKHLRTNMVNCRKQ